jgi:hypothetical protein
LNSPPIPFVLFTCLLLILFEHKIKKAAYIFLPLAILLNLMVSLRVSAGWDEFYINLKHSWVLKNFGMYSFNILTRGEATVDFLPYFLTGLLGKVGFPLQETVITINLLGNVLFISLIYGILKKFLTSTRLCFVAIILSAFFPPFVVIGSTGFTAGLFASLILLSFYLWISKKPSQSIFVLSILPLIRTEGILFSFLFWLVIALPSIKKMTVSVLQFLRSSIYQGTILTLPLLTLSLWRLFYFGSFVPNPIVFKNTNFLPDYLHVGMSQLSLSFRDFEISLIVVVAGIAFFLKRIYRYPFEEKEQTLLKFWFISTLFILSYHIGGGDWFPIIWSRYTLPSHMFSWLTLLISMGLIINTYKSWARYLTISLCIIVITHLGNSGAYRQARVEILSPGLRWERIDSLASFGEFLKMTSEQSSVIASPEVATIMFFAERDVLDLLGVANPEVAKSPLNPISPGDLIHRKRNPKTIYDHRPGFIAFWGCESTPDFDYTAATHDKIADFIGKNSLSNSMINVAAYRGGSMQKLVELGYKNVTVFVGQRAFNYFVSKDIYEGHLDKLKVLGINPTQAVSIKYEVSKDFLKKFPDPI